MALAPGRPRPGDVVMIPGPINLPNRFRLCEIQNVVRGGWEPNTFSWTPMLEGNRLTGEEVVRRVEWEIRAGLRRPDGTKYVAMPGHFGGPLSEIRERMARR